MPNSARTFAGEEPSAASSSATDPEILDATVRE